MRAPNVRARDIWPNAEAIDAHVDAIKAELAARGISAESLGIDIEARFREFRESRQND